MSETPPTALEILEDAQPSFLDKNPWLVYFIAGICGLLGLGICIWLFKMWRLGNCFYQDRCDDCNRPYGKADTDPKGSGNPVPHKGNCPKEPRVWYGNLSCGGKMSESKSDRNANYA